MISTSAQAKEPDCSKPDNWAGSMAFVNLKNAGLATNSEIDFTKTKVVKIASEKIGKNLYRQVHLVDFQKMSGQHLKVVAVNDASKEECSVTGVDVFVIEKQLGIGPIKLLQKSKEQDSK